MPTSTPCSGVEIRYKGNGGTKLFTFPFTYLDKSHIFVSLWNDAKKEYVDVASSDWSFANPTTIEFVTAPPAPPSVDVFNIRINRRTDLNEKVASFYPGSAIRANDLNDDFDQLRLAIQESRCQVYGSITDIAKTYWNKNSVSNTSLTGDTITELDQLQGRWSGGNLDELIATAAALKERYDVILSPTMPPDPNVNEQRQGGKLWIHTTNNTINYWDPVDEKWIDVAGGGGGTGVSGIASVTGVAPIQVAASNTAPVVSIVPATTSVAGSMSAADKAKLNNLSNYNLPVASATVLGGFKVGANLSINPTTGVLSSQLTGALVYRGIRDVTQPAPSAPTVGDCYINSTFGEPYPNWTGLSGDIAAGNLLLWDGSKWGSVGTSGSTTSAITVVSGTAPVVVANGTSAPVISVDLAEPSVLGSGGHSGLMSATDKERLDSIQPGAADGTVTNVIGSGPIKVASGSTVPVISIDNASTSAVGVVQLADATALTAGTPNRVVTADQAKATNDALSTTTSNLATVQASVVSLQDNTAKLNEAQSFGKGQRGIPLALTDGGSITPDFSLANNFSITISGTGRTLQNPTNLVAGQSGCIVITNAGSNTLGYGTVWKFAGGTKPTLTALTTSVLTYYVASPTLIVASMLADVK